ncbi:MAG: PAS domain-containing protein [Elusimicrobia bacterium]|nr:PAS domain-containing protein [Elusimicrobiota bacterium]
MPHRKRPAQPETPEEPRSPLTEAELVAEHAERFAALIEAFPDLVYFKDRSLRNVAVNSAYARFAGLAKDDILGRQDEELLPSELARQCRESDEKVLETGRPVRAEQTTRSGEVIDTLKAPVLSEDGRVIGIVGVSRVVTAQKRAEESLRRAEERLLRVLAEAPVVVFQVDRQGIFTLSEGRGLKALGLRPGEAVGRSVFDMYAHNASIVETLRRALAGEEVTIVLDEGGMVYETHLVPQRDARGRVESVLGVSVDATERARSEREIERLLGSEKSLREEAEKASRAKDDFLALLSHELRTPMTAMMGWTYLLRQKDVAKEDFAQALDIIERNMHLQSQIIEDLLDVSKIFTGRMRVDHRSVDLAPLVRGAVDVVRPAAQARGIRIDVGSLPAVVVGGDPERLQQVFWNLLSNSLKFTPDGGKVMVRLRRTRDGAEVTVTDSGIGIDAEYLPHVFDPFSQAERAMTREHRGLGLGLAIVKHIIQLHGGGVEAASEGTGCGSTFTVRLPLVAEVERAVPAPGTLPAGALQVLYASLPKLDGLSVLVAAADPEERRVLDAALRGLGAAVEGVSTAAEALSALERKVPDVLVADLGLPGTDGYALIRKVRQLPPEKGGDVPAAALTTQTRVEDRTQVLMAGFQMYLPKPVEPAELAAAVKALARRRP